MNAPITAETSAKISGVVYPTIFAVGFVHLLNDTMQAVVPSIFPIIQNNLSLSYTELGIISFSNSLTASIMQPLVGWYTDKKPKPWLLPLGMVFTLLGMAMLAYSNELWLMVVAVMGIGLGSAVFHPEGSRIVQFASAEKRSLGQSIFQVGGNIGTSLAPLMTILIFKPMGQVGAIWFVPMALIAVCILYFVSRWYALESSKILKKDANFPSFKNFSKTHQNKIYAVLVLIVFLTFARTGYFTAISNYYSLYLIKIYKADLDVAQAHVFVFLLFGAFGTLLGGVMSDRFGKKNMILFSMVASLPLSLLLPHTDLFWSYFVLALVGFSILSGFSATLVYALELIPGKIGTISGLIFGLAFGLAAIGSLALGKLADIIGIGEMMFWSGFFPVFGLLTFWLPNEKISKKSQK